MDAEKLLDELERVVRGNREAERLIEDLRSEVDRLVDHEEKCLSGQFCVEG